MADKQIAGAVAADHQAGSDDHGQALTIANVPGYEALQADVMRRAGQNTAQSSQDAQTGIDSAQTDDPAQLALPGLEAVPFDLERGREFFPTPAAIARCAVTRLIPDLAGGRPAVLDAGAGDGVWGLAARGRWADAAITGVDLPGVPSVDGFDTWIGADFLEWAPFAAERFDLIVSNPPFTKLESFIELSHKLLKPGGYMVYFLRQAVRAGTGRGAGLWRQYRPQITLTSSRRPSFTGDGVSDPKTEYTIFVWQQGYNAPTLDVDPFDYEDESTWPDAVQLQKWIGLLRAASALAGVA